MKVSSNGTVEKVVRLNIAIRDSPVIVTSNNKVWVLASGGIWGEDFYLIELPDNLSAAWCYEYGSVPLGLASMYRDLIVLPSGFLINTSSYELLAPSIILDSYGLATGNVIYTGYWGNNTYVLVKCDVVTGICQKYAINNLGDYWLSAVVSDGRNVYYQIEYQENDSAYSMILKFDENMRAV